MLESVVTENMEMTNAYGSCTSLQSTRLKTNLSLKDILFNIRFKR